MSSIKKVVPFTQEGIDDLFNQTDVEALGDSIKMNHITTGTAVECGCSYCEGEKDLINTLHYEYHPTMQLGQAVHIEGNRLVVEEETIESKQINFCPMCGRNLRGADDDE